MKIAIITANIGSIDMICEKKSYQNKSDAVRDMVGMSRKYKQKYKVYECSQCGNFHIATLHKNTIKKGNNHSKYPIKINEIKYRKQVEGKFKKKKPKKPVCINNEKIANKLISRETAERLKLLLTA